MFNNSTNIDVTPDPRLINTYGESDQEFHHAMNDILDNSIDAGATKINFFVQNIYDTNAVKIDEKSSIIIADNGHGMNLKEAEKALSLGASEKLDNEVSGKFGVGLKTAANAFGFSLSIITKREDGELILAHMDAEKINTLRQWVAGLDYIKDLPKEDSHLANYLWNRFAPDNSKGTIIIIDKLKIDKFPYKKLETLQDFLIDNFGKVFRIKIEDDVDICVNNNIVNAINPFEMANVISEIKIEFPGKNAASLKFYEKAEGTGVTDEQGCYAYRNGRLIDQATWWKIRKSVDWTNTCLVEIIFDRTMDEDFGVSYTKMRLKPSENIINKIKEFINPIISGIVQKRKSAINNDKAEKNKEALEKASKKMGILERGLSGLNKSLQNKEKRNPKQNSSDDKSEQDKEADGKRTPKKLQKVFGDSKIQIEDLPLGESADLYETFWDTDGNLKIQCNSNHSYYRFKTQTNTMEEYYYNIYSMARPSFNFEIEEDTSRDYKKAKLERNTMKAEISQNYRVIYNDLLSNLSESVSSAEM